jgi:hypothetical protein
MVDDVEGGLLGKAKSRDLKEETPVDADVAEVAEAESSGNGSGLLERVGGDSDISDAPTGSMSQNKVLAIVTGIAGVVLMVMLPDLPVFSGLGVLAVFGASLWFASRHSLETSGLESLSSRQWVTLGVAYLLLAGIPYIGGMDFGGSTSITNLTYSEDGEEITLTIRHTSGLTGSDFTSGDIAIRVMQSGTEVDSRTVTISLDSEDILGPYGMINLNVADFYSENSISIADGKVVYSNYTVEAQISGSDVGRINLDAFEMTRTVTDVDEKLTALFDEDGDCEAGKNRCVRGIYFEVAVGRDNPQGDDGFDPRALKSNYWINATVNHVDSSDPVLTYPMITLNGFDAGWDDDDGKYGNGSGTIGESSSRMILDGSTEDPDLGVLYFPKEDWDENGFGCYTFTISVTQNSPWSGTSSATTTISGTYLWEDIEGEQRSGVGEEDDPDYEEFQRASC